MGTVLGIVAAVLLLAGALGCCVFLLVLVGMGGTKEG